MLAIASVASDAIASKLAPTGGRGEIQRPAMKSFRFICAVCLIALSLQGCVGLIVGTAVDVAVEVVKVPFKVGGAIVDVVTDDDDEKDEE